MSYFNGEHKYKEIIKIFIQRKLLVVILISNYFCSIMLEILLKFRKLGLLFKKLKC